MNTVAFIRKYAATALLLCGAITLFTVGFALGRLTNILVAQDNNGTDAANVSPTPPDMINVGSIGEVSILPDTDVEWITEFEGCRHIISEHDHKGCTGFTKSDIENEFPNAEIDKMTAESVIIRIHVDEYCPEHYMLIMTEPGSLCVFRTNPETLVNELYAEFEYNTDVLDEAALMELSVGHLFGSMEEINSYLENAET